MMGNMHAGFENNTHRKLSNKTDSFGPLQVSVFGASKVGKTSLISQLVFNKYPPSRKNTVAETVVYQIDSEEGMWKFHFLDTSGVIQFPAMWRLYIATSNIFLVVYSFDRENSLQEARDIIEQIKIQRGCEDVPIILIGNKCDLPLEEKKLSFPAVDLLSIDWDVTAHVLTSASNHDETNVVVEKVLHHFSRHHRHHPHHQPLKRNTATSRTMPRRVGNKTKSF